MILSILRFNSKDADAPMNSAHPSGKDGLYKVEFVLSRPNSPALADNRASFDLSNVSGDSHIFLGVPQKVATDEEEFLVAIFEANLPEENFLFYGYPNDKGFLSKIVVENVKALNFQDAQAKAYNALAPTLSRISLLLDVPLHISNNVVTELSTNNHMSSLKLPYLAKTAPPFENYQLHTESSKFASLYREALNSNSSNYQFLCFYKIIEGIRDVRRQRVTKENQEALAKSEKPVRKVELIPSDRDGQAKWLNFCFTPQNWSDLALAQVFPQAVAGRKVTSIINPNSELDMVRNRIAHATGLRDETKETLTSITACISLKSITGSLSVNA